MPTITMEGLPSKYEMGLITAPLQGNLRQSCGAILDLAETRPYQVRLVNPSRLPDGSRRLIARK
jgi:hypothetical protein